MRRRKRNSARGNETLSFHLRADEARLPFGQNDDLVLIRTPGIMLLRNVLARSLNE